MLRCLNVKEGWFVEDKFCAKNENCSFLEMTDGVQTHPAGTFVCGRCLVNPNWGITSFDNFVDSAIMVWQIITLEGWTAIMYKIE